MAAEASIGQLKDLSDEIFVALASDRSVFARQLLVCCVCALPVCVCVREKE